MTESLDVYVVGTAELLTVVVVEPGLHGRAASFEVHVELGKEVVRDPSS